MIFVSVCAVETNGTKTGKYGHWDENKSLDTVTNHVVWVIWLVQVASVRGSRSMMMEFPTHQGKENMMQRSCNIKESFSTQVFIRREISLAKM